MGHTAEVVLVYLATYCKIYRMLVRYLELCFQKPTKIYPANDTCVCATLKLQYYNVQGGNSSFDRFYVIGLLSYPQPTSPPMVPFPLVVRWEIER